MKRTASEFAIAFPQGETDSGLINLGRGVLGPVLVPSGSDAIGETLQIVAVGEAYDPTPLMSTPKTLSAGANAFTEAELLEIMPAQRVVFRLSSPVTENTTLWLLWKS